MTNLKKCGKCSEHVDASAKKCKHCHSDLRNWFLKHKIITGFLIILIIGMFSNANQSTSQSSQTTTNKVVNNAKTTSSSTLSTVGEEGRIHVDDVKEWFVAVDEEAFDQWIKVATAKDEYGLAEMLQTGRLFVVPNDTKVKVLDIGFGHTQVRILEGSMKGKSGWVSYEFIVQ